MLGGLRRVRALGRPRYNAVPMGTPERDQEIVQFYMQHVVALNIAYDKPDGKRTREACTCFVLEILGDWFLVTAGHILEDRYAALPHCKNVESSLFDAWHPRASRLPVPFPLLDATHFAFYDKEFGLDIGLIHLEPFYVRQLKANGVKAFDETAWKNPPREMIGYALIGLPDQFIKQRTTSGGAVTVSVLPTVIYLKAVDPPPDMKTPFPRFYGKLPDRLVNPHTGASLDEMSGFSGSPIIGFKVNPDGQMKYWLVAVQSGWHRGHRVVAGPLIPAIVAWLEAQARSS